MNNRYQITKRSPDGKIYNVIVESDNDLEKHVSSCFKFTDEEILSVIKLPV